MANHGKSGQIWAQGIFTGDEVLSTLPLKLERQIFEMVALSRPVSIPGMMLVAWRVKHWLEPLLYRTLLFGVTRIEALPLCDIETFIRIARTKPPSFLRNAVRDVIIRDQYADRVNAILTACSGVVNLNISRTSTADLYRSMPLASPGIDSLMPTHLHCDIHDLVDPAISNPFSLPFFSRLTHLNLFYHLDRSSDSETTARERRLALCAAPQLTHLALPSHTTMRGAPILSHLLDILPNLHALVILSPLPSHLSMTDEVLDLALSDVRFVMIGVDSLEQIPWQVALLTGVDR
ncbi:hypothetical protein B0H19DRAFT_1258724 [Mycena capillaripes]|nr:hypothetical protein B0H19DRAFT_1270509 [Mycena capillaripes]KAJ6564266.1 hypothetical protein B0H19DRAFT_1258724 [Mycena capillaripes]